MHHTRKFCIAISILLSFLLQARGADKNTDENRPYEFGFDVEIDGSKQQHRHEKKDKDGIIMGEFGFVTADDVYHVTVYATDKEGRFKVLSMKNIHLKSSPAPSGPTISARQGHSLALPSSAPAAPVQTITTPQGIPIPQVPPGTQPPFKQISLQPPGRSCSSCSLPTTTPRAPPIPPVANIPPQNQQYSPVSPNSPSLPNNLQSNGFVNQPFIPQVAQTNYPQQGSISPATAPVFSQQPAPSQTNYPSSPNVNPVSNIPNNFAQPEVPLGQSPASPVQGGQQYSNVPSPSQGTLPQGGSGVRASKQYTGPEQQFNSNGGQPGPGKPTLVSAQMQIVDKNTDINALRPGEKPGLPPGLTKNDMTQLLYTFNYTVGFHGHFEEGYTNGDKKGYYFVTGRNGVRTRIDYVADNTGFHPKVSQEVLDLLSEDVPKPETEKDQKYGLKGYEFKWLYYPVDSKRR